MGTSGAYAGAGGRAGRDISAGASEWIDSLAGDGAVGDLSGNQPRGDTASDADTPSAVRQPAELPPRLVSGALGLLRPRSARGAGSGGGGGGGGPGRGGAGGGGAGLRRSSAAMAGSAGRAGAAAYAYVTGDRAGLAALGLDFDRLRALGDPIEVTQRIVDAACGQLSGGSLESHEERYVAATVAEWVFEQTEGGSAPSPEEIARHSIAVIVAEVLATEINESLSRQPEAVAALAESELIEAAEILAGRAELSVNGAMPEELSRAIEDGIQTLRQIYGVSG
jgi:hypothetical protein